jgi:hypothetical protein
MDNRRRLIFILLMAGTLGACGAGGPGSAAATAAKTATPPALAALLPRDNAVPGWATAQPEQTYHHDDLFNLVDGQADSFFSYNFEAVATQRYQNAAGTMLMVEVWQVASPADAYGLFTFNRAGVPAAIGSEGDTDPGRRVAFWQDRYYVQLNANQTVPDSDLMSFARLLVSGLPSESQKPALVNRLPGDSLEPGSPIFFHAALSLQNELWLSDDNVLSLGPDTDGVVARYDLQGVPAHLLIIRYPTAARADAALAALRQVQGIDLAAAAVRQDLLGAVVGKISPAAANSLLAQAINGAQP